MNMNKEDREKLLDVAGFLQGWLAFKKPVPPDEVVRLHFDLVMEVLAKNNEVLDLVSKCCEKHIEERDLYVDPSDGRMFCNQCGKTLNAEIMKMKRDKVKFNVC